MENEFDFIPISLLQGVLEEIEKATEEAKKKLLVEGVEKEKYEKFILAKIELKNRIENILFEKVK